MLEDKIEGDLIFTTKKKVGMSGQCLNNYLNSMVISQTDNILILDTTPYEKEDYIKGQVSLRNRDSTYIFNRGLTKNP